MPFYCKGDAGEVETEDDLIKRLNEWKDFVENSAMRVNVNKTKV